MLLAVAVVQAVTAGWRRRLVAGSALLIGLGLVVAGSDSVETIPLWLADGAITGLVLLAAWVLVLRHQPALVPLVTAAGATAVRHSQHRRQRLPRRRCGIAGRGGTGGCSSRVVVSEADRRQWC